jgi:hypothetical protein
MLKLNLENFKPIIIREEEDLRGLYFIPSVSNLKTPQDSLSTTDDEDVIALLQSLVPGEVLVFPQNFSLPAVRMFYLDQVIDKAIERSTSLFGNSEKENY